MWSQAARLRGGCLSYAKISSRISLVRSPTHDASYRSALSLSSPVQWKKTCIEDEVRVVGRRFGSSPPGTNDGKPNVEKVPNPNPSEGDQFEDVDDEFIGMVALDPEEEARTLAASTPVEAVESLSNAAHDMTPEEAEALVKRMVAATSSEAAKDSAVFASPPPLSRHTLRVLCASRTVTNSVHASDMGPYPVEAKVTVRVNLDELGLGKLARAALEEIAGPRMNGGVMSVTVRKYASRAENLAHAYGLVGRVVAEAHRAVGEQVDNNPLEEWDDVMVALRELTDGFSSELQDVADYIGNLGKDNDGVQVPLERVSSASAKAAS